ncbi:MAG TPA: serine/threonine-protein kinase, partial [Planctomicrobium sp.]|nr:serine/threonine-protein kinase [Planctomicrobium sp.]
MTLENKDKKPENEKKDVGGTLNLPGDYSDEAEQPPSALPLQNVSTPVPAGSDLTNSCTVEMEGEISALPKIVRTIDSRTINMDELAEEERSVWENFAGDENAQTLESHYPIDDSGTSNDGSTPQVGVESNLLLVSRKLLLNQGAEERQPDVTPDYKIERTLGRGGMGVVYAARQASLDRVVAIKVIQSVTDAEKSHFQSSGRFHAAQKQRREQFLSEAVVTGDLDHPNIVPIHDVAKTHEGDLFYSMKKVDGTPWDAVINTKSIDDNLEILLKVADAVGFAHSRGVVHRDLKPENVMLGGFGVVMVMDWGLAVPTPTFQKIGTIRQTTSLGGSPAYMAPELALGPIDQITPSSDI